MSVPIALVVSDSHARFERVSALLARVGFQDVVRMPAIFIRPNRQCGGTNGHQAAFRNMWRLINRTGSDACIFEDDVELANARFRAERLRFDAEDLLFLGEFWMRGRWWTNHAACLTPLAARTLLRHTAKCLRIRGNGIDRRIKKLCERKYLRCRKASRFVTVINGSAWWGDFYQNRSIPSYLHDSNNLIM